MKANELQINNFLQAPNVQFVIPVYQRNYDWTIAECKDLLNDIISVETEDRGTHFIGSIVFVHEGTYSTNEVKELVIIDGQQRLTTINILYVALYRFAKENGYEQDAERLYNMFLTNQYVKNESSKLKLKQTDNNSLAFKAIMLGTDSGLNPFSNVTENYNYFRSIITAETFELILRGLNRLIFVEISLERDKDDPQRIFESLNSTGLDLSQSDLIRNFILMDLPPKEQNRIFETIWNPIEENARDLVKQNSLVSDYIRDYLTLRNKKIPNKNKVYAEFKSYYANKKDEAYYQDLEKIKSLSIHYKKFINPTTISDYSIKKELEYINRLEINVAYPFLLQVFEDYENSIVDHATLIKILKLIQSFAWRRFIVGLPTSALNKIFMTLYGEIDQEVYYDSLCIALLKKRGSVKFPTNQEVKTSLLDKDLYNIQSKNRSYFFELLENFNNREHVNTSSDLITIEHIFPRNPSSKWTLDLTSSDFQDFKENRLNTISNLTLSGNNGALSNLSFIEKRDMNADGKEQGYAYSRLWLNDYLKKQDCWSLEKYNERFEIIYKRFLKIWEFPDVEVTVIDIDSEQNIYDAEPPTNKKLDYFIFEDKKIDEVHVAQMYFYILRSLYEKNAELLLENSQIIKLSKNSTEFRTPQVLINGYFIEANIDSNSKFSYLKKILSVFKLEDELLIKYNSNMNGGADRYVRRKKFWAELLPVLNHPILFTKVNPTEDFWLSTGAGISGLAYTLVITKSYAAIEFTLLRAIKEENKSYFNRLESHKSEIETAFGKSLLWEKMAESKMCKIKYQLDNINFYNDNDLTSIKEFFIQNLGLFYDAFNPIVNSLKKR